MAASTEPEKMSVPDADTTPAGSIETAPAPQTVDASQAPAPVDASVDAVVSTTVTAAEELESAQPMSMPAVISEPAAPVTTILPEPAETAAAAETVSATPEITSPAVPAADAATVESVTTPTAEAASSTTPPTVPLLPLATATGERQAQQAQEPVIPAAAAAPQSEFTAPVEPRAPASAAPEGASTYQILAAAREAYWLRDYQTAENKYRQLTVMEPDNPDGYGELGNMYFSQGMWEQAASAYFEAGVRLVEEGQLEQAQQLVHVIRGLDGTQADELNKLVAAAQADTH